MILITDNQIITFNNDYNNNNSNNYELMCLENTSAWAQS